MTLFKKISFKLKEIEEKFIQSKLLIIILPVVLVLVLILYSAPLILNNKQLRNDLEQEFSRQLGADLKINGEIKTSLFPAPNITVNNFFIRNLFTGSKTMNLHVKKAKVNLSIMSVISSKFDITNIESNDVTIEIISSHEKQKEPQSQKVKKLISQSQLNVAKQKGIAGNLFSVEGLPLKNENFFGKIDFNIKNLNLIYFSKLGNKKELNNISISTKIKKNSIFADGSFYSKDSLNKFSIKLFSSLTNKDSIINISSKSYDFLANGKFSSSSSSKSEDFFDNFDGNISMSIFNLKSFLSFFLSKNSRIFKKISDDSNPIIMNSKIKKEGQQIDVLNCEIESEVINGLADFYLGYDTKVPIFDAQLDINFVDFDKILTENNNKQTKKQQAQDENIDEEEVGKNEEATVKSTEDMRDIDLNLELKISKAKFLLEEIKDISVYSSISKNGEALILPLKFKTPGNGNFRITGILDTRNNSSKFLGNIDAKGDSMSTLMNWLGIKLDNLKTNDLNSFSIYSNIFLKPSSTHFDNLYINIIDGPEILGESNLYYHSNPYAISKFNILNLDFGKFFHTSTKNTYLSPGSLLKKVLWLANFNFRNDIDLKISNLKLADKYLNSEKFKIRLGKGYFEIDKMQLETLESEDRKKEDITISLALQLKELISSISLAIESNNFKIDTIDSDLEISLVDKKNENLINSFFALPSLENFSGKFSVNLKNLQYGNKNFKNTKIKGDLNSGVMKFQQFRSLLNEGRINFDGSTAIKFNKSISGNITFNNFPIKNILPDIFNINSLDGIANISSSISSIGSNINEFISNLNLKAKYNAANVTVQGFGLNTLIQKLFNIKKYHKNIEKAGDTLRLNTEKTNIKEASGTLSISKKKDDIFVCKFSGTAFNGVLNSNFSSVAKTGSGQTKIIFLTGNKDRQIPINIASNFQGSFEEINFVDNLKQANSYIERAKKFYSNPKNKNRNLLRKPKKKQKEVNKTTKKNNNRQRAAPEYIPARATIDPATMQQIMKGNYPIPAEMQQQLNQMQPPR